ncbi:MAG: hypothetical protein Q4C49_12965 [Bacillota bacterium]|nr:hypothetical protein [Bacillota bacterium]
MLEFGYEAACGCQAIGAWGLPAAFSSINYPFCICPWSQSHWHPQTDCSILSTSIQRGGQSRKASSWMFFIATWHTGPVQEVRVLLMPSEDASGGSCRKGSGRVLREV